MARGKINKSAKIRETFESMGHDARPKDVIAELAKRRIKVTPAAVSNIKAKLGNGSTNGHKSASDTVSIAALVSAKKFIDQMGGLEKAQVALSAIAKLR
jgi:hypothetical protein